MQSIITNWPSSISETLGEQIQEMDHNLPASELFSDTALARLIDQTPREDYHVSTMDPESHDPKSRREGVIEGLAGKDVLEAIQNGHLWLNLRNSDAYVDGYGELLEGIYAEFQKHITGFKSFKEQLTILISSPFVHVGYHCDVPGQTLWQVRGRKRIWLYPNRAPFLPQPALEKILLGEAHEVSLKFEPEFDDEARIIDLEPGRMLAWPHNAPHRIVNHDCLNVSLTTEHWTSELRNAYAVNYANGLLRSRAELSALSQSTTGLSYYPKLSLAAAHKLAGIRSRRRHKFKIDFRVDPHVKGGFKDIPAYEMSK